MASGWDSLVFWSRAKPHGAVRITLRGWLEQFVTYVAEGASCHCCWARQLQVFEWEAVNR